MPVVFLNYSHEVVAITRREIMGIKAIQAKMAQAKMKLLEIEASKVVRAPKARKAVKGANVVVNATSNAIADQLYANWEGTLSKVEAQEITTQVLQGIVNTLFSEDRITLPCIGTLSIVDKPARKFRTIEGKIIEKPARKGLRFSPSLAMKKEFFVPATEVGMEKPAKAKK
jgi:nucleoid DNA-binding protein